MKKLATLILCAVPTLGLADALDINLSNSALGLRYDTLHGSGDFGRSVISSEAIYTTDEDKNDNVLLNFALQIIDQTGSKSPGLEAGLGPKLYLGNSEYSYTDNNGTQRTRNQSLVALGLGGQLEYRFPAMNRFLLGAQAYYAPNITSMIAISDFFEFNTRLAYEVSPASSVYLGYRLLRGTFHVSDATGINREKLRDLDNKLHLGLEMDF